MKTDTTHEAIAHRIGGISSLVAALLLSAFAVGLVVTLAAYPNAVEWTGIEAYARNYRHGLMFILMMTPFLLAPALLVTAVCFYQTATQEKKTVALLGLAFIGVYAAQITFNYYIQLTVVAGNIETGNLQNLDLWAFFNPRSIGLHLELLGYGMLSVGLVFWAFLFHRRGAEGVIFWILLTNGVLNAAYIFEPFIQLGGPPIVLALFSFTMPAAMGMIAVKMLRRW